MPRYFGTPDGVRVGQQFIDRRELHEASVHRPTQAGISGTKSEGADSIVVSGGYGDDQDFGDYILYTGHGGKDPNSTRQIADQSVEGTGNAGLITSMIRGLPVRVVRGAHKKSPFAPPSGYRYAGLFLVTDFIEKPGKDGFLIIQFRLDRIPEQAPYVVSEPVAPDPAFATTVVTRRIRDSAVARQVKSLYGFRCQACGTAIEGFGGRLYAEGAHVRPLGRPHLGADVVDNLLCLCPNHHTQLDNGGLFILQDMTLEDRVGGTVGELEFKGKHLLLPDNARYHREFWTKAS
jgi:putative restriction endonuclease